MLWPTLLLLIFALIGGINIHWFIAGLVAAVLAFGFAGYFSLKQRIADLEEWIFSLIRKRR